MCRLCNIENGTLNAKVIDGTLLASARGHGTRRIQTVPLNP